ncbi:MAG: aminotransferase class V-fold PLP-dependent enzyme [Proteobacteria bacterium]|nr:aminotransferase class V-fold PLP-dependent enzyme [Pseudomonadota bacterium]
MTQKNSAKSLVGKHPDRSLPTSQKPVDFETIREDFPSLTRFQAYLDTAFIGLMSRQVKAAREVFLEERFQFDPLPLNKTILGVWIDRMEQVRTKLAFFLGASDKEIAFTLCTGCGSNIALNGINWQQGDNVVTDNLEYPTDLHILNALNKKGVEVRIARNEGGAVSPEQFDALADKRTRAIVVSHVSYLSGYRHDLAQLADIVHGYGGYLFVDASQSVGSVKVNVAEEKVDFLSGIPYKWLAGPNGVGFLYVREALIPRILPDRLGWANIDGFKSFETLESNPLLETARRYEYGTLSFDGIHGLNAALDYVNRIGIENIEQRNLQLVALLRTRLCEKGFRFLTPPNNKSSILSFFVNDADAFGMRMREQGIYVTARHRNKGYIRVSPHFYNNEKDIKAFVQAFPNRDE